jgi:GNAT superfamily N-acetyltransferase
MTTTTSVTIRPFHSSDYKALAAIQNATYTEFTTTVDDIQHEDEHRAPHCLHRRWVAERDGRVVGVAAYVQLEHVYHPRKFSLDVLVDPERLQQRIGSTLWTTMIDALRAFDPLAVDCWTREDMTCRVRFLEKRGFTSDYSMWASELDVANFDPTPFEQHRNVTDQGIVIRSLADLAADEQCWRKLYDLWNEVRHDVPIPAGEVRADTAFEKWLEDIQRPTLMPDAYFLALENGEYVGTTALWQDSAEGRLKTGLTAVKRSHRRRGIALALKLHAIDYARAHGVRRIVTDNESGNRPMLSINEQLGFVKFPAWRRYQADWTAVVRHSS